MASIDHDYGQMLLYCTNVESVMSALRIVTNRIALNNQPKLIQSNTHSTTNDTLSTL